jgi:hypothetical protein
MKRTGLNFGVHAIGLALAAGVALLSVRAASPALAQPYPVDQALLDCPLSELSAAEQASAAAALAAGEDSPATKALVDQIEDKALRCSKSRSLVGTVG